MKIYSSPFSEIDFETESRRLTMIWGPDSAQMAEQAVKLEIQRIVKYVTEYGIRNVVVDSRNYVFRDNLNIQTWINRSYIPVIMDSSVQKYAIVVDAGIMSQFDRSDDEETMPVVRYFADIEEARIWTK